MSEQRWQPIETAPKDGTSILVTMAGGYDGPYYVLFWNGTFFESVDSGTGPSMDYLTHWMPLPAPPSVNQEQRGDNTRSATIKECIHAIRDHVGLSGDEKNIATAVLHALEPAVTSKERGES